MRKARPRNVANPGHDGSPGRQRGLEALGSTTDALADKGGPEPSRQARQANRGLGVGLPTWPRSSGLPVLDRAHVELMRLHGLYRSLIDRVVTTYTSALKEEPENARTNSRVNGGPDPVEGLSEWLAAAMEQIKRQRDRVTQGLRRLDRGDRAGPETLDATPVAARRAEVERLQRGLPFAETWVLLAIHQLAPLAVARILRCRVWPQHVGARMATLLIAHRALAVEPWGPTEGRQADLPLSEFPLDAYEARWKETWYEAIEAVRGTLRVAKWLRDRLLRHEGSSERPENDRDFSALYVQIIDTGLKEWGDRACQELDRLARAGLLNVASRAIQNDLLDRFRPPRSRRPIACPVCHRGQVRPPAICPACGTGIPKQHGSPRREISLSGDTRRRRSRGRREGVVEAVGSSAARVLDRASREAHAHPERTIEILIRDAQPDEKIEEDRQGEQLLADPRAQKMLQAVRAGARTQKDIAAYCEVTDKTIRRWEEDLRSKYSRYDV